MDPIATRILQILLVPRIYSDAFWTIAPLFFALILMQMYFGKYKTEQLGWNTAFGNSISLMWVSMALLKYLHDNYGFKGILQITALHGYLILIAIIILLTISLTIANFYHALPKRFAFLISSSIPINLLAYFVIVLVIGQIPLDRETIWACLVIFIGISAILHVYKKIIDPDKSIIYTLKQKEIKKHRKIGGLKRSIKAKAKRILPGKVHKILHKHVLKHI